MKKYYKVTFVDSYVVEAEDRDEAITRFEEKAADHEFTSDPYTVEELGEVKEKE